MNKTMQVGRQLIAMVTLLSGLVCVSAASAADVEDDLHGGPKAIEIIRQGIPHDALFALEMSGEWGLTVGAFGLMLETSDGGGSWKVVPAKTHLALFGIARAGDKLLVVGQQGTVLTKNGSDEWETVDSGLTQRLLNVGMNMSGLAIAVGEFGYIGRSRDAGKTWEGLTVDWGQYNEDGYEPHLYDAIVNDDGSVLVAGEFGLILRSTDGGDTFSAVNQADESVFDMYMARDGSTTGYAVGQEGLLLKTNDHGLSWQRLDPGTKANLLGVWAGNGEVVITGIREMLRSSDDGATFTRTHDVEIVRTWFQGVSAGVAETQAGEKGFLRQQSVYVVGHRGTIARVVK